MTDKDLKTKSTVSVSFGFKRKIETKVDESKVVKDKIENDEEFLDEISPDILSKKSKTKEEKLVIPLIRKNKWNMPAKTSTCTNLSDEELKLQELATKEIIKESAQFLEKELNDDSDKEFESMSVPLLLKNQVPDGFETDDKLNVELRPDEATLEDYEAIPIKAFGMAMLRGMGWDPKVGIGKTFKQNVKMLETSVRPKGLGLGASIPASVTNGNIKRDGINTKDEALEMTKGAYVQVQGGTHKKKYGVVVGLDPDNALCMVKFALGGNTASVGEFNLLLVSKNEYSKYSKDLSRLTKAHEEREKQNIENSQFVINEDNYPQRFSKDDRRNQKRFGSYGSSKKTYAFEKGDELHQVKHKKKKRKGTDHDREENCHKEKKRKHHKQSKHESEHAVKVKEEKQQKTWLLSSLRVRLIDEKYRKGRFYREKLLVVDVFDRFGHCSCKTEDGTLLDDIHQDMLETVVPRSSSDAYVLITSGGKLKHDGKLAKILEKDKEHSEAYLQLIENRDIALRVSFDHICEYAGDVEAFDDF